MIYTDGDKPKQAEWRRLISSIPADYVVYQDGTNYRGESTNQDLADIAANTNAATVINNCIAALPNYGRLYCKGDITITDTLDFDGTLMAAGSNTRFWFLFDRITVNGNVDALHFHNLAQSFRVDGHTIYNPTNNNDKALIKCTGIMQHSQIHVDWLNGDATNGKSIGIEMDAPTATYFMNNDIKIKRYYNVEKALYLHTAGTGWANTSRFDLGHYEGVSPRQIHIQNNGTGPIGQSIIIGTGGHCGTWNPQALSPTYAILLETTSTGTIYGTTFQNYRIYSPNDEIYRADAGVIGTKFIGGMPYRHLLAWWHDGGSATDFVSCWNHDEQVNFSDQGSMISPYWHYLPLAYRMGSSGQHWFDGTYIVTATKASAITDEGSDQHTSWLAMGKRFDAGTYEWEGKLGTRDTNGFAKQCFGLEKHHGYPNEGIIAIYDWVAAGPVTQYRFYTDDDAGGGPEVTDISAFVAANTDYVWKIEWTSGTECKLYIDGTLRATHNANVPTSGMHLFSETTVENADASQSMRIYWKNRSFHEV